MSETLRNKILTILKDHKIGTLATMQDNRPYSRFMMFFHENLVLYTATRKDTHKVEDIEQNPYGHILLGYEGNGWNDSYVEIQATVRIEEDPQLKERFWNERLKEWIPGPDHPDYVLLQLTPETIRYFEKPGSQPQILK